MSNGRAAPRRSRLGGCSDGIREKDGVKLAPRVLYRQVSYFPRVSEAIQGYMRKIGIDWRHRLRLHDCASRDGQAGYELWTVTCLICRRAS